MSGALASLRGVGRRYARGEREVVALDGVSLDLGPGESLAITGPSGSGKSTLLGLVGCLDRPTAGRYHFEGRDVATLSDAALSRVRNRSIGFVFQSFHLIPQLDVVENVQTPLLYSDVPESRWRETALRCLAQVGLEHRATHRPGELSGGEAQRVAIARALVNEPRLILADEPTGNLDSATGGEIADLLVALHASGRAFVLVTHDAAMAARAQRVLALRDGRVEAS